MSIIEEKCKQKGVRLTDQRKVIAKILSESKDFLWGFSGKRIIEQNLREKLADEVQTSQWVFEHGGIDKIVPRKEIKSEIYNILSILLKVKEKEINNTDDVNSVEESLQTTRSKQVI